ncbi:MAG: aldolase/citrate lyase family protein [Pusillimonas sp.]
MKQRINHILRKRAAGETPLGLVVQTGSAEVVEMAAAAGLDFIVIDCEHGSGGFDKTIEMLRAADAGDITPLVRLPDHTPHHILRMLDAGAMGIVAPNVNTGAQAEAIVAAAKYRIGDGGGRRGSCPSTRANWHLAQDWESFARWSNEQTLVWVIVEDSEGVANIDEIAAVPGLSAIVPGPFDLAQAMGHGGAVDHPEVRAALSKIAAAAARNGVDISAALMGTTAAQLGEQSAYWRSLRATSFWVGGDRRILSLSLRQRTQLVQDSLTAGPASR